jgi:MFS family permease
VAVPESASYWEGRGAHLLWFSALSGPAAWAINQLLGYSLVKPLCAIGNGQPLAILAAAALALVIGGAVAGWRCLRLLPDAEEDGGRRVDRSYFMAVVGIALNGLIAVLIVTAAVSPFILSPCE